jgi:hypothetical protein
LRLSPRNRGKKIEIAVTSMIKQKYFIQLSALHLHEKYFFELERSLIDVKVINFY